MASGDLRLKIRHVGAIADQVAKRWDSNPSSVTGLVQSGGSIDHNFISIKDIDLIIKVDGPYSRIESVWIYIKGANGSFRKPGLFCRRDRKLYNEATEKLVRVQDEIRHGKPDELDKLICDIFPEAFEEYLGVKKDN